MVKLKTIAHSRAGDKGDTLNLSLIAYNPKDYTLLEKRVTAETIENYFKKILFNPEDEKQISIKVFRLPNIPALNIVIEGALGGGVTRSLRVDKHGKTLSSALLEMEL